VPAVPSSWQLRAPVVPALRRGFVSAVPVAAGVFVDLKLDSSAAGALSTGALLAGFIAFEAPWRTRCVWQLWSAPAIGAAAALGVLTRDPTALAALTMAVFATMAGLTVAVSRRLAIAGMTAVLALLLAQGLSLDSDEAVSALLLGAAGAALEALLSLAMGLRERPATPTPRVPAIREAWSAIRASLDLASPNLRHAVRWGTALGIGVATYHLLGLDEHGFWIPLTVLFVLRPTPEETVERIAMRAAGTLAGLLLATSLAELAGMHAVPDAVLIGAAAAFSFALLAIEYALFTTAITAYAVLLPHALGQPAFEVADERALATAIGIAIAALALVSWGGTLAARHEVGPSPQG
jgi:hypothetical protein